MKVIQIFRYPREGGYSIEEVFSRLKKPLQDLGVELEYFVLDGSQSIWQHIRCVKKLKADVFHITGDCNYVAAGLPASRTVLTVHDIGHYTLTLKGWKKWVYGLFWWRFPLRRVGHITTISTFSKQQLVQHFTVPEKKISVIANPLPDGFYSLPVSLSNERPRIMQIGSGPNKNLEGLIAAVKEFDCVLVLVNALNYGYKEMLEQSKVDYEQYQNLIFDQVRALYQTCDVLFFASHYEGFGLPIIEAQSCGVPVITSTVASMPEVAGTSTMLVDPKDTTAIREAIIAITTDSELRRSLIQKGFENVKRFAPQVIAGKYLDVYKAVFTS